jgi:hypothetical protein
MSLLEDFKKSLNPTGEKKEESKTLLPSFSDVRVAVADVRKQRDQESDSLNQELDKIGYKSQEEVFGNATSNSTPAVSRDINFAQEAFDLVMSRAKAPREKEEEFLAPGLRDKSDDKFKLSDLIIPEVRAGFSQSFGDSEKGTASDIYTNMIPAFGKERASEIAYAYQDGVDAFGYPAGIKLTESEKSQFDGWKQGHWAKLTLDAADVVGVGIAVKAGAGFLARTGLRRTVSQATKLDNVKDMHELILQRMPELRGTQELDDLTDIIIASRDQNPDKLAKVVQRRAQDPNLVPRDGLATEAQRISYENGVPVLRKSTPDSVLLRRDEALEAIKGNREELRLSNSDILQAEVRSGTLPLSATADDTIDVFRVSPQGRRVRAGEELSLSEDFARSVSEGAPVSKVQVPLADLIRLPDGTFTFAPERLIKESPILKFPKNLSTDVVESVKDIEAKRTAKKLADQQAAAEAKRKAAAAEQYRLEEPVRKAKDLIKQRQEKVASIRTQAQQKITRDKSRTVKQVTAIKKDTVKKVSEIDKDLLAAKQKANVEHVKKMAKAKTKLQKTKEKNRYQKQVSKLNAKARADKAKVKGDEKISIAGARGRGKTYAQGVRATSAADLKKANAELKNARSEAAGVIKKATPKPAAAADESTPNKTTRSSRKKEAMKPVDGDGAVKESRLFESTQTKVRETRKELGETINTKEYEFYREATNKAQLKKASDYISKNGVEQTIKDLEIALRTGGDAADGILNNSLMIALEPKLLESGMSKYADNLLRLSSRLATRMGQEIQILSMLDRNNPLNVLYRLNQQVDKMVDSGGIAGSARRTGVRENTRKAVDELIEKSVNGKMQLSEAVDAINVCK